MGWQPIETAPERDPILVWNGASVSVAKGFRMDYADGSALFHATLLDGDNAALREGQFTGETTEATMVATHWMRLPAPPAIAMETGTAIDSEAGVVAKP